MQSSVSPFRLRAYPHSTDSRTESFAVAALAVKCVILILYIC